MNNSVNNKVSMKKIGKFYNVFDDGTFVLYYIFNYRIVKGRVGFPCASLEKVINKLEEKNINYEVYNENRSNDFKKKNNFSKFVIKGKRKQEMAQTKEDLLAKIENLSEDKIEKIVNYIKEVVNEQ